MNITKLKKPFVLTVLFFLPVLFLLFLYPSKHNYKTLDVVKKNIPELSNFVNKDGEALLLENHLTVLGFLGKTPMEDAILALICNQGRRSTSVRKPPYRIGFFRKNTNGRCDLSTQS